MVQKGQMIHYIWHTGHQINETISMALHAGIPQNILKHTEWADNYFKQTNKHVAIGYGILRGTGDIFKHNFSHNVDYYEVDRGYINPGHFDGYYRISKNGMQAKYVDKDLPSDRLDKLKFRREDWFNPTGHFLVCAPSDYILNYYDDAFEWMNTQIKALELFSIKYKVRHKSDTNPLEYDLKGASGVLTFNSNVAIDALIKSIPSVVSKESILFNALPTLYLDKPAAPTDNQINKILRFISYNQFTLEEIRNGTAWRLLHE